MSSLVIGRFQPLHDGHVALIQTILDEGKDVVVAIRDTDRDEANPYSTSEREAMFMDAFAREVLSGQVQIIIIPDISEVCYGRNVGWGIREIRLDPQTEAISATEIRAT